MRLQDKRHVAADTATQRKKDIDEGMKIASKVDILRETLVTEEGKLRRFREETIRSVQTEIDDYIRQKDKFAEEIYVLEQKKDEARIPLDAEWETVRQGQSDLLTEKQTLWEKSDILKEREKEIEHAEREVEIEKERAKDLTHRSAESLAHADGILKEARESAATIRNKAQVVLGQSELKNTEAELREKSVEVREQEVDAVWDRVRAKEVDLAQRELTLKDKYKTLERTLNRLQNHGG